MGTMSRFGQVGSNIAVFQPRAHQRPKYRQSPKCQFALFLLVHAPDAIEGLPPQTVGSSRVTPVVPTAFDINPSLHETHPTLESIEHGRDRSKNVPKGYFNDAAVAVNQ